MSYELSLNSSCELLLTINLPSGLNNIQLKLIDHYKNESVINSSQYTITDNVITYTIPSSLYNIEGNFGYYVVATGYESEHIDINAHLCNAINNCQQIEITSGEYSLCVKKQYEGVSYCSLITNTSQIFTDNKKVNFGSYYNYGNFTYDIANQRIVIPKGTKCIRVGGHCSGNGYSRIVIVIIDEDNITLSNSRNREILIQTAGNGYWSNSLPTQIVPLDETKEHYVWLEAGGYDGQSYHMNTGFGEFATSIYAEKIM